MMNKDVVVDIAANGKFAIDELQLNLKVYDALLMVMQMPVMNGI